MFKKILSVILAVSLFLFILSFSISLPIYVRPFYYAHIDDSMPFSESEIRKAYDEVMDYLTLGKEFKTGVLKHSAEGASHFADVKALFNLNATVLVISAVVLIIFFLLRKRLRIPPAVPFYTALSAIILPVVIGLFASLNIDKAFVIFHKIFFPGKDNWLFNPATDEIITILPMSFFVNCAVLIGTGIVILSSVIMIKNKNKG